VQGVLAVSGSASGFPIILWSNTPTLNEGDCACPTNGLTANVNPPPITTRWQTARALYAAPLPDDFTLAVNPHGTTSHITVLDPLAYRILDAFDAPTSTAAVAAQFPELDSAVLQGAMTQLATLNLLQAADSDPPSMNNTHSTLTAWLHITNACQLACTYCYVDKSADVMSYETGQQALNKLFAAAQRHGYTTLKLKYAGGEPSLEFDTLLELHEKAQEIASQRGIALQEVMLSNGVALRTHQLESLRDAGIRLMISLDGFMAGNQERIFVNGAPNTGHGIRKTITRALALGITPYLSITVSPTSAPTLPDVVQYALDHNLPFHLNLVRHAVPEANSANHQILIDGLHAVYATIEAALPSQSLYAQLLDHAQFGIAHQHACGMGAYYVVIDHRGQITQCHMTLDQPVGDVWQDDPVAAVRTASSPVQNRPVDERPDCQTCQWKNWCAGGCPLLSYRATGRNDAQSPYCDVYRALYPAVLRLEGLRLLKWQHIPPT
jgi:uncharacterized protein